MNHCSITKPFKAFVRRSLLYNLDPVFGGVLECKMFGISSYAGHYPTFQILVDGGAMFSYVPAHMLSTLEPSCSFELSDLVYHKCSSDQISYTVFEALLNQKAVAFVGPKLQQIKSEYVGTVDWYKGNELLHLLLLETATGCLASRAQVSSL